jgi:hypothetical protein
MLGPVLVIMGVQQYKHTFKLKNALLFFLPFVGLIALYGLFNFSITGAILPNTFYAKQMEYAQTISLPLLTRLGRIFLVPLSGAGLFLVPGFVFSLINAIRKRNWWLMTLILWFFGYGVIYAFRLPMTYQHGRYLIPLIPGFYLIGIIGTFHIIERFVMNNIRLRNYSFLVGSVIILVSLVFAISGELALIEDNKTIDSLMVQPARWINDNTVSNAVIAVHDIGAMGYFGERKIIDLAGLIQPELISIIGNELEIKNYLVKTQADYLVVLKDWYSDLDNFGSIEQTFTFNTPATTEITEIKKLR